MLTLSTPTVRFSPAQLAELERRLDQLAMRLNLEECGRYGDLCAALLPEVYGEPSRLPDEPTEAFAGSPTKIEIMAARHSLGSVIYHPQDAKKCFRMETPPPFAERPRRQAARTKHGERPQRERKKKRDYVPKVKKPAEKPIRASKQADDSLPLFQWMT